MTAAPPVARLLSGWGRTSPTRTDLVRVDDDVELTEALAATTQRGVVARGLGRSYGDAATNAGGLTVELDGTFCSVNLHPSTATVTAGAGASLDKVMRTIVPRGFFVPVTPGTRYVTVGGAVASDVHGKNHHRDGSMGHHVTALDLNVAGTTITVGPDRDPDAFWATVGGMGLTGVIERVSFSVIPIPSSRLLVSTERAAGLDATMAAMTEHDHRYRYSVAWIDLLARGASMGRSVITSGDFAPADALAPAQRRNRFAFDPATPFAAPPWAPPGLLNKLTVRAFNELWYRKAPVRRTDEVQSIGQFFHPLDGVDGWNRLYGPKGFLQYQFVVPFGQERTLTTLVDTVSRRASASFLAVLKRFGNGNPAMLSFPRPGWTLALDLPIGPAGTASLLDDLDELVVAAGGRTYFAKDSRMSAALVPAMYPELDRWRAVRDRLDPHRVMQSDLARRLDLVSDRRRADVGADQTLGAATHA